MQTDKLSEVPPPAEDNEHLIIPMLHDAPVRIRKAEWEALGHADHMSQPPAEEGLRAQTFLYRRKGTNECIAMARDATRLENGWHGVRCGWDASSALDAFHRVLDAFDAGYLRFSAWGAMPPRDYEAQASEAAEGSLLRRLAVYVGGIRGLIEEARRGEGSPDLKWGARCMGERQAWQMAEQHLKELLDGGGSEGDEGEAWKKAGALVEEGGQ